jgi:hypothetical protein
MAQNDECWVVTRTVAAGRIKPKQDTRDFETYFGAAVTVFFVLALVWAFATAWPSEGR